MSIANQLPSAIMKDFFGDKLTGSYMLKLVEIKDLSVPSKQEESDFLNIEEEELERDHDSAKSKSTQPFKRENIKGSRMLCLTLTDGENTIKAVEYKEIPFLKPDIPIGTKVLIKGPVELSLKVMLLRSHNIEIIRS